jgi:hypothetical protein
MPVNLWPAAFQALREAGQLKGLTRADGWPKGLTPRQLAVLQWPGNPSGVSAWLPEIEAVLTDKSLPSFSQHIETPRFSPTPTAPAFPVHAEDLQVIAAPFFAAWLCSQGIEPSPNIQAWIAARAPATTVPAPAKRRTWLIVASPYIVDIMRAGQYATAKELCKALEAKAGTTGSPFDIGVGNHRWSLIVRETGKPLARKTVQNRWPELLAAAAKK